jgi:serine/threonine protein kinase
MQSTAEGIADYDFVRRLGTGNHGTFFLARRPARLPVDAEFVAVKVLSGETSAATFRRATRELRNFAAVRSPYLVSLYDAGQQSGVFYYAMEYLAGGSLADPARSLSVSERLRAVSQAARAVATLHAASIVHRDVKPANILLGDGPTAPAKLSDLGLSHVLAPGMTLTGMGSIGSVEYLDPAQLQGDAPTPAADVWSLGVTLHRVASGTGLYGHLPERDALLALRTVLSGAPVVSAELDPAVAHLVRACLSADADDRPTAAEFADRLDALV